MSFGFSVGDVLAVGKLIKDITSCLQDAGGSKTEYQELLRELESLQQALQHLDKLQNRDSSPTNLDSIKYAALSCRRPLEQFLGKIRKHDRSLGVWGKSSVIKSTADKLRWGLGQKDDVNKLQNYLNIHIGTINILLAEHGLEKMSILSDKSSANQLQIRERLDNARGMIQSISGCLTAQTLVVQSTQNTLSRLLEMIGGEFKLSWRSLGEMVAKLCVSSQQTYAVVCEIRGSLTRPDTRWSFFQAPSVIEDALGYKFPVPSEYDFDLMDAVIKQKFKAGPGSLEVEAGNYEYFNAKNSNDVLSRNSRMFPGTAITMAVLVIYPTLTDAVCPMPKCGSKETTEASGGCRICCICNVQFSPTKKKRKSLSDLISAISSMPDSPTSDDEPNGDTRARKRAKLTPAEEYHTHFKNVRLTDEEVFGNPPHLTLKAVPQTLRPVDDNKSTVGTQKSKQPTRPEEFNEALIFIDIVKKRFRTQPSKYQRFLEILQAYQRGSAPTHLVYGQMKDLFSEDPDLLEGFRQFWPETHISEVADNKVDVIVTNHDVGQKRKRD